VPDEHFAHRPAAEVVRDYPTPAGGRLVGRYWPAGAGSFDPADVEEEFRHALTAVAAADRALEANTNRKLFPEVVRWWNEAGGLGDHFRQRRALSRRRGRQLRGSSRHGRGAGLPSRPPPTTGGLPDVGNVR
jgi:hypothetical protein